MTDPDTLEKARALSLTKWLLVRDLTNKLFDAVDSHCGFCLYRIQLTPGKLGDCDECLVQKKCNAIQANTSRIEENIRKLIDDALTFLTELKI